MAAFPQPPFFSSLRPITTNHPLTLPFSPPQSCNFPSFKNSRIRSSISPESSPLSDQNSLDSNPNVEQDPIKLAFAKAKAYKTSIQSSASPPKVIQKPIQEPIGGVSRENDDGSFSVDLEDGDVGKEVPLAVKLAFEKAKEYKKGKSGEEVEGVVPNIVQQSVVETAETAAKNDELKDENDGGDKEVPLAVKLALEKAKEYKNNKGNAVLIDGGVVGTAGSASGLQGGNEKTPAADKKSEKSSTKKNELSISSIDFMGLNFADKKIGRGLPAGLVPLSDPFPEGDLPDVEILVGDASKFEDAGAASKAIPIQEDDAQFYKPKVSTWGVFPRPSNISKTFGGGRNISPGEALESAEEKAIKEARTKQLVAAYKSRIGLKIDPKLKSECEKALKDGDTLMDLGKLKEALPFYEKVMEKLVFQNELHGLAALQWSICQDSLSRPNEAREMYEKLQSHPSPAVSKRARQFFFGFQAMEMMKVSGSSPSPLSVEYQNYFDAFVPEKTNYVQREVQGDEDGLIQALPYVIFLVSPIVMVLLIAASKLP